MMNFSFHPEALQEYIEATHYYREISPSLANAFVVEIENSINQILLYPQAWQPIGVGVRRCLVKRYPFGMYKRLQDKFSAALQICRRSSRYRAGWWEYSRHLQVEEKVVLSKAKTIQRSRHNGWM